MTPEQLLAALQGLGWQAEIVLRADVRDLVPVSASGLLKCVDGRASNHLRMDGPKMLGGIYALATGRGIGTVEGLQEIVAEVKAAGFVPSVHGDDHAQPPPMGCGYFKLWSTGQLDGVAPPQFDAEQGRQAVEQAGGVYEQLTGSHTEKEVLINWVPDTTLEPTEPQRFVVDAWAALKFGLELDTYLPRAAETVTKLGGPKNARIIVP